MASSPAAGCYPSVWLVGQAGDDAPIDSHQPGDAAAAVPLGLFRLVYLVAILALGWFLLRLTPGQMQTLTFTMLAFAGQGNLYVLRARDRFWRSHPAPIMLFASACDLTVISVLAASGILSKIPVGVIALIFASTVAFTFGLDAIKLAVRARIRID